MAPVSPVPWDSKSWEDFRSGVGDVAYLVGELVRLSLTDEPDPDEAVRLLEALKVHAETALCAAEWCSDPVGE